MYRDVPIHCFHLRYRSDKDTEKQHRIMVTKDKFHWVEKNGIIILCNIRFDLNNSFLSFLKTNKQI